MASSAPALFFSSLVHKIDDTNLPRIPITMVKTVSFMTGKMGSDSIQHLNIHAVISLMEEQHSGTFIASYLLIITQVSHYI